MKLFKNKRNKDSDKVTQIKIVTQTGNGLYTYGGDVYKSDIVRSCIRPLAAAVGKLSAKHIRDTTNSNQEHIISVNPEPYMRILLTEPNPLMSMQKLLEKLANQLELNSNAFALIMRDANGYPIAIYPIPCVQVNTGLAIIQSRMLVHFIFLPLVIRFLKLIYCDLMGTKYIKEQ